MRKIAIVLLFVLMSTVAYNACKKPAKEIIPEPEPTIEQVEDVK